VDITTLWTTRKWLPCSLSTEALDFFVCIKTYISIFQMTGYLPKDMLHVIGFSNSNIKLLCLSMSSHFCQHLPMSPSFSLSGPEFYSISICTSSYPVGDGSKCRITCKLPHKSVWYVISWYYLIHWWVNRLLGFDNKIWITNIKLKKWNGSGWGSTSQHFSGGAAQVVTSPKFTNFFQSAWGGDF